MLIRQTKLRSDRIRIQCRIRNGTTFISCIFPLRQFYMLLLNGIFQLRQFYTLHLNGIATLQTAFYFRLLQWTKLLNFRFKYYFRSRHGERIRAKIRIRTQKNACLHNNNFYKPQVFSGSSDRPNTSIFELKIISGYGTGSGSGSKPFNQLNPSPFEMKIISGYGTENGSGPKSGSVPKRKRIWKK
jgi:hypothetical protein